MAAVFLQLRHALMPLPPALKGPLPALWSALEGVQSGAPALALTQRRSSLMLPLLLLLSLLPLKIMCRARVLDSAGGWRTALPKPRARGEARDCSLRCVPGERRCLSTRSQQWSQQIFCCPHSSCCCCCHGPLDRARDLCRFLGHLGRWRAALAAPSPVEVLDLTWDEG